MSTDKPVPPDDLPNYVAEPIQRQEPDTLESIRNYVDNLLVYHQAIEEQDLEDDEFVDKDEELVDVEETNEGTIVTKKQQCGKNCDGCPHGPYKWRVTRTGDTTNWEYLGKANS